jgi:hypothetical protein
MKRLGCSRDVQCELPEFRVGNHNTHGESMFAAHSAKRQRTAAVQTLARRTYGAEPVA